MAVSGDQNIKMKELEKITKYQDVRLQVQKLCDFKATVKPIVDRTLGTVSEVLEKPSKNHCNTHSYKLRIESSIARNSFRP